MADEAHLRIILSDEGGPADLRRNPDLDAAMGLGGPLLPLGPETRAGGKPFDPVAEAKKLIEESERRQKVEEARLQVLKEQGKLQVEEAFNATREAQRLLEMEQRRLAVRQELALLKADQRDWMTDAPAVRRAAPEPARSGMGGYAPSGPSALGGGGMLTAAAAAAAGALIADKFLDWVGSRAMVREPQLRAAGQSTSITRGEAAQGMAAEEALRLAEAIPVLGGAFKLIRANIEATTAAIQQQAKEIRFSGQQFAHAVNLESVKGLIAAHEKRVDELKKIDTFTSKQKAAEIERNQLAPLERRLAAEEGMARRTEALRAFSPEIQAASARARVSDILTAQRQAQSLGPMTAANLEAQAALRAAQLERQRAHVEADAFRRVDEARVEAAVNRMAVNFETMAVRMEAESALMERDRGRSEKYLAFTAKYNKLIYEEIQKMGKRDEQPPFRQQLEDLRRGLGEFKEHEPGGGVNPPPEVGGGFGRPPLFDLF